MRRHGSMLNDLAATMSSAGAGAVLSGGGADYELWRRELRQQYASLVRSVNRAQRVHGHTTDTDAQADRNQRHRPNVHSDADLLANRRVNLGRNRGREQHGSIPGPGDLRLLER